MTDPWAGRRVLLTGGTSLLGFPLAQGLQAAGATVRVPTRGGSKRALPGIERRTGDLRDSAFLEECVEGVDHVFHLASHRLNVREHRERRDDIFLDNVLFTENLIRALRGKRLPVTFFSTALVGTLPPEADPVSVPDGYLAAKLHCERAWMAAAATEGFPLLVVRPVSAYGPGDRFVPDGNVIPALFLRCEEAQTALEVWGSGNQRRTFVYAPDVAAAVLRLLRGRVAGTQAVSPPNVVTIHALAEAIRDLVHPGLPLRFDHTKPEGPDLLPPPVHPLLGDFPWMPLATGLRRTLDQRRANL